MTSHTKESYAEVVKQLLNIKTKSDQSFISEFKTNIS